MLQKMQSRLAQLRDERASQEKDNGFTLIELLVVVVIIGILIAIAIPLYLNYQKSAKDKAAQSDLRAAISTIEQCNANSGSVPASVTFPATGNTNSATPCTGQTITKTGTTVLNYLTNGTTGYMLQAYATGGSTSGTSYYCYSNANGGSVVQSTTTWPTAYSATFTC